MDALGAAYVAGFTNTGTLPGAGGFGPTTLGSGAFAAKILSNGTLAWSGYLGGLGWERLGRPAYVFVETDMNDAPRFLDPPEWGGYGVDAFTPIVNAPEVAILGVSKSSIRPVWNGEKFKPRLMLPLSLSYDHRVIDGAAAARFTAHLAQLLGDMRRAML